ncbi:MAG: 3-deoxy-7-phosphoheptulonate synthase class II [Pirellulaceae bacterium]|nr:3-deoxy-7-phosphoheptulonate synthase class II [Pirellulaceae bacterium]
MRPPWTPTSWQSRPAAQQPQYDDPGQLDQVVASLSRLPPLVTSWEIEALKQKLAQAAAGDAFLLQGGDCSESFEDCNPETIVGKLKVLLQISLVLVHGSKRPIIRLGRIAGQYAKPRSAATETRGGVTLPCYRGDLVNGSEFTAAGRRPDPQRLLAAYQRSALTLNFIRALSAGGFADLHHPEAWDLRFVGQSSRAQQYHRLLEALGDSIRFLEAITGVKISELERIDFFTSHEGLHLLYEQSQTRTVPHRDGWYNLTAHLPWIGDRTRSLDGAHVEFFRGIRNPIAVKLGPSAQPDEVLELAAVLNPHGEPGRLTLIHRFGQDQIQRCLPPILAAARRADLNVLWSCDPMHGNTLTTADGWKTRRFDHILSELHQAFAIHRDAGTHLGGVHLELTGENVTECTGGAGELAESDLPRAYKSSVDPRLNYEQAMEIAFLIAAEMRPE